MSGDFRDGEMNPARPSRWEYRAGGFAAVFAALFSLTIWGLFALTGLGAAGDRSYGSFSGLTFVSPAALVFTAVALYRLFAERVNRLSRVGLVSVGLGLTIATLGHFGGFWLSFPRSGNVLIAPGTVVMMAGLVAFGLNSSGSDVPSVYRILALLIGLLPIVFLPPAATIEALRGHGFPPSLHDNYFRVQSAVGSVLWLGLGWAMIRGPTRSPMELQGRS